MVKQIERLSALQVAKATTPGCYPDGAGLYLQVAKGGSKSWLMRYSFSGRPRWMGLGSVRTFGLAEARERAKAQRKVLADGIDPIDEKKAKLRASRAEADGAITFDRAAELFIEANRTSWTNLKHADQWSTTLKTYASPVIGSLPVKEVTAVLVLRILQPIWASKTETASRLRGRIEKVLDWAKVHGYRSGDNPAAWRGQLSQVLPRPSKVTKAGHHAALPWQRIAAFTAELRQMKGVASLAAQFIVLTATRTSEVLGATWDEIDFKERQWVIPAGRMKAGKEHRVPLSQAALDVLEKARTVNVSGSSCVFPGRGEGPLSNMACLSLLRRMGHSELTIHGFRSTFRDWAAEQRNYPREVCEMALAHSIADATEAAYRRGDLFQKRTHLMNDWAKFCETEFRADPVHRPRRRVILD